VNSVLVLDRHDVAEVGRGRFWRKHLRRLGIVVAVSLVGLVVGVAADWFWLPVGFMGVSAAYLVLLSYRSDQFVKKFVSDWEESNKGGQ
jgi:hypothetical protein